MEMTLMADTPHPWPEAALTLLDTLWAIDTHMAVIRRKLMGPLGYYPLADDVRFAANRYRASVPKPAPTAATSTAIEAPPVVEVRFVARAVPDRVRKVAPGTYPARGYSMLRGTVRG
jgi:hypothetical protein